MSIDYRKGPEGDRSKDDLLGILSGRKFCTEAADQRAATAASARAILTGKEKTHKETVLEAFNRGCFLPDDVEGMDAAYLSGVMYELSLLKLNDPKYVGTVDLLIQFVQREIDKKQANIKLDDYRDGRAKMGKRVRRKTAMGDLAAVGKVPAYLKRKEDSSLILNEAPKTVGFMGWLKAIFSKE